MSEKMIPAAQITEWAGRIAAHETNLFQIRLIYGEMLDAAAPDPQPKPCPTPGCGGRAEDFTCDVDDAPSFWYVACVSKCALQGPQAPTKAEAVRLWDLLSFDPPAAKPANPSCPCEYPDVPPCSPNCTCRDPVMSGGCSRCCRYVSLEQRLAAAKRLAVPAHDPALLALLSHLRTPSPWHEDDTLAKLSACSHVSTEGV